jgi:hypothetical protein
MHPVRTGQSAPGSRPRSWARWLFPLLCNRLKLLKSTESIVREWPRGVLGNRERVSRRSFSGTPKSHETRFADGTPKRHEIFSARHFQADLEKVSTLSGESEPAGHHLERAAPSPLAPDSCGSLRVLRIEDLHRQFHIVYRAAQARGDHRAIICQIVHRFDSAGFWRARMFAADRAQRCPRRASGRNCRRLARSPDGGRPRCRRGRPIRRSKRRPVRCRLVEGCRTGRRTGRCPRARRRFRRCYVLECLHRGHGAMLRRQRADVPGAK